MWSFVAGGWRLRIPPNVRWYFDRRLTLTLSAVTRAGSSLDFGALPVQYRVPARSQWKAILQFKAY